MTARESTTAAGAPETSPAVVLGVGACALILVGRFERRLLL
jgi:hypothetical protein